MCEPRQGVGAVSAVGWVTWLGFQVIQSLSSCTSEMLWLYERMARGLPKRVGVLHEQGLYLMKGNRSSVLHVVIRESIYMSAGYSTM
jgi:hypothetical protein